MVVLLEAVRPLVDVEFKAHVEAVCSLVCHSGHVTFFLRTKVFIKTL